LLVSCCIPHRHVQPMLVRSCSWLPA
jgi:hypothetical protein